MTGWRTWREASTEALYGPQGFYRRPEGPAGHFRTSVHVGDAFAGALATLAASAGLHTVVDVGAGRGELAGALGRVAPDLDVVGVEIGHPDFAAELPTGVQALVVANEWLDNVPLDVAVRTADGMRLVEVDATGAERPGPPAPPADVAWLERWWPSAEVGDRAEIGRPRDAAWAAVVGGVDRGIAVAVDYAHTREARPPYGTLTGFRAGREVAPVPDGSMDLTAHVAIDACAAAVEASATVLTAQRQALRALGVRGELPPHHLAGTDPAGYLRAIGAASQAAELLHPAGLGGYTWLVHAIDVDLPPGLAG
ncbi:MAG: hypothetical protein GEV07_29370 [Streptosporangiales bacterium]|nr:hypothetical protein [Streptosporangiales bacterium]